MLSARPPRRSHVVKQHGVGVPCYRATKDAYTAAFRRDRLDVRALDTAAEEALMDLYSLVMAGRVTPIAAWALMLTANPWAAYARWWTDMIGR